MIPYERLLIFGNTLIDIIQDWPKTISSYMINYYMKIDL